MEKLEFTVHGEGVSDLPSAIGGYPKRKRADYAGDGFVVIVTEQYYFKTNSDLQATTIFELVDDTTCKVAILSGGGASGLFGLHDWGTESDESNRLLRKIRTFCEEHDLEIETRDDAENG